MVQSDTTIKVAFPFSLFLEYHAFIIAIQGLGILLKSLICPSYIQKKDRIFVTYLLTCKCSLGQCQTIRKMNQSLRMFAHFKQTEPNIIDRKYHIITSNEGLLLSLYLKRFLKVSECLGEIPQVIVHESDVIQSLRAVYILLAESILLYLQTILIVINNFTFSIRVGVGIYLVNTIQGKNIGQICLLMFFSKMSFEHKRLLELLKSHLIILLLHINTSDIIICNCWVDDLYSFNTLLYPQTLTEIVQTLIVIPLLEVKGSNVIQGQSVVQGLFALYYLFYCQAAQIALIGLVVLLQISIGKAHDVQCQTAVDAFLPFYTLFNFEGCRQIAQSFAIILLTKFQQSKIIKGNTVVYTLPPFYLLLDQQTSIQCLASLLICLQIYIDQSDIVQCYCAIDALPSFSSLLDLQRFFVVVQRLFELFQVVVHRTNTVQCRCTVYTIYAFYQLFYSQCILEYCYCLTVSSLIEEDCAFVDQGEVVVDAILSFY